MSSRISMAEAFPGGRNALYAFEKTIAFSGLDPRLYELIKVRASQLNACGHCINLHINDALTLGETEQRLFLLDAWRETDLFTEKERAVLALTEALTLLPQQGVPDAVYEAAEQVLSEAELGQVIMGIIAINCWNRVSMATKMPLDNKSMLFTQKDKK